MKYRVERARNDYGYGWGWVVMDERGWVIDWRLTWAMAMSCALSHHTTDRACYER